VLSVLEDDVLRGNAPVFSDLSDLLALLGDTRVGETLGGTKSEPAVCKVLTRWKQLRAERGLGPWFFRLRETGAFVGYAGVAPAPDSIEPGAVELLYALLPGFWGRGLATRMSSLALENVLERPGNADVVAYTLTTNLPSRRVLEKLGFSLERRLQHAGLPHVLYRLGD